MYVCGSISRPINHLPFLLWMNPWHAACVCGRGRTDGRMRGWGKWDGEVQGVLGYFLRGKEGGCGYQCGLGIFTTAGVERRGEGIWGIVLYCIVLRIDVNEILFVSGRCKMQETSVVGYFGGKGKIPGNRVGRSWIDRFMSYDWDDNYYICILSKQTAHHTTPPRTNNQRKCMHAFLRGSLFFPASINGQRMTLNLRSKATHLRKLIINWFSTLSKQPTTAWTRRRAVHVVVLIELFKLFMTSTVAMIIIRIWHTARRGYPEVAYPDIVNEIFDWEPMEVELKGKLSTWCVMWTQCFLLG